MPDIKISSVIIARNEEANIARCIESQLNCIDEIIIILDETTTDNTGEVIKKYPEVRQIVSKWKGYAGTKEYAVSLAGNEWIFWIDADEEITPQLKQELLFWKKSEPDSKAYSVPRKAFFLGKWMKHSGWYPGRVTRLFNKNFAHFSTRNVHEHLIVDGPTGRLKNDLNHYTDENIRHYFNKFNLYTTLAADELISNRKKFRMSDIMVRPFFHFFKMYIIRRGFLDGIQGLMLAVFSSLYVFTKYSKLWEKQSRRTK